jgi:primosomal protein N'
MKIISVIPLKKGVSKENLTYFTSADIPAGHIVSVPIRNKKVLALIVSSEELQEQKTNIKEMSFSLKKIEENKGRSIFLPEFLEATFEAGKYFAQNKGNVAASLIPNVLLEEYDKIKNIKNEGKNSFEKNYENKQNLKAEKLLFQYPFLDRISAYKTLIRESFARGKSIFIVLPTESDINKFAGQLSKGIEQFVFTKKH